jgi:hypothetical protein
MPRWQIGGAIYARWAMFKFTIRDLVLLTLIAALGIGWWVERRRLAGPLEKLAIYEAAEQRRLKRRQDEKRLKDLKWQLQAHKATHDYGAPNPANGPHELTTAEVLKIMEEAGALEERLAREPAE